MKNKSDLKEAVIILKIDEKTKKEAQELAEELGFSLSSLISAYLKQITRTRAVTFTLGSKEA